MTFLDCFNSPKFDFTQNQSGGKIIKFQQSQALTSHFESFWSIVPIVYSVILWFWVNRCMIFSFNFSLWYFGSTSKFSLWWNGKSMPNFRNPNFVSRRSQFGWCHCSRNRSQLDRKFSHQQKFWTFLAQWRIHCFHGT